MRSLSFSSWQLWAALQLGVEPCEAPHTEMLASVVSSKSDDGSHVVQIYGCNSTLYLEDTVDNNHSGFPAHAIFLPVFLYVPWSLSLEVVL